MSGALGAASEVLGTVGALLPPVTVSLGTVPLGLLQNLPVIGTLASMLSPATPGVKFTGMASPESMPFGGAQMHQVHRLPGGARVIDVFGRDDRDVEWSGQFFGSNAVSDARKVDAMRVAGNVVPLAWDDFALNVVVVEFLPDYTRSGVLVRYRIKCVIATIAQPSPPSLLSQVKADLATAGSYASAISSVTTGLATVMAGLPTGGSLPPSSPLYPPAASGVQQAQTNAASAATAANASIAAITATPAGGTYGAAAAAQALAAQTAAANANLAAAYLGRASNNLANQ